MPRTAFALAVVLLISGCASSHFDIGRTETVLALNRAWVDGQQVEYVTTDISDAAMARAAGVNFVPRLRDAIGARPSLLERVYKFPPGDQISIFQSAPRPVGAENADRSYSPLWRIVLVTRTQPGVPGELWSEEELLLAEEKGLVVLEPTDIVVNCPVTRLVGGAGLLGVR